eukprot:8212825-Prorocentrum_lima.AAC.1
MGCPLFSDSLNGVLAIPMVPSFVATNRAIGGAIGITSNNPSWGQVGDCHVEVSMMPPDFIT